MLSSFQTDCDLNKNQNFFFQRNRLGLEWWRRFHRIWTMIFVTIYVKTSRVRYSLQKTRTRDTEVACEKLFEKKRLTRLVFVFISNTTPLFSMFMARPPRATLAITLWLRPKSVHYIRSIRLKKKKKKRVCTSARFDFHTTQHPIIPVECPVLNNGRFICD